MVSCSFPSPKAFNSASFSPGSAAMLRACSTRDFCGGLGSSFEVIALPPDHVPHRANPTRYDAETQPSSTLSTHRLSCNLLKARNVVLHHLELLGSVSRPIDDLANDAQRVDGAVRLRGVAGEFLVGQVGIVLERAGWLDDINAPTPVAHGELRAPDGRIQGSRQVDVRRALPLAVIGSVARRDEVTGFQVSLCSMEEGLRERRGSHQTPSRMGGELGQN